MRALVWCAGGTRGRVGRGVRTLHFDMLARLDASAVGSHAVSTLSHISRRHRARGREREREREARTAWARWF